MDRVLAVFRGHARVQLGGPIRDLKAGDTVVIPANRAHRRIAGSTDFTVTGANPGASGRG